MLQAKACGEEKLKSASPPSPFSAEAPKVQTRLCVFPPSQVAHFNIPRISSSVAKRLFGRPMRGGSEWPSGRESEVPRCVMQGWLTPLGAWTIPRLLQLRPCQNLAKISPPHWKSRRRRRERRRKKAGFGRSQRKEEEGAPPLAWHHRRQQLGGKKPVALKKAAACGRGGEGIPPAFLPLPLPPPLHLGTCRKEKGPRGGIAAAALSLTSHLCLPRPTCIRPMKAPRRRHVTSRPTRHGASNLSPLPPPPLSRSCCRERLRCGSGRKGGEDVDGNGTPADGRAGGRLCLVA